MSPIPPVYTLVLIIACFATGCANRQSVSNISVESVPSSSSGAFADTNQYHSAYVDVLDTGHPGEDKLNDETTIRGLIRHPLRAMHIESDLDDSPKADLHVICRFKHKWMWPEITQGATIVMTEIGKCSIKIVDKKTGKVLIEKSWVRGKKNGTLDDFIDTVFAEWEGQRSGLTPPLSALHQQ
jgi:hypothetical protein